MKKTSMVRSAVLAVSIALILFHAAAFAAVPAQTGLTKIAEGVYAYVDAKNPSPLTSFGANAGIVVGRDGVVVVDTLTSAKKAQRFIRDIRAVTDKPIRYVINTHHHLDHSLGNCEFVKLGAAVMAQENAKKDAQQDADSVLKRALNYGFTAEALAGTTIALPTMTFTDAMTLDLGDRIVELSYAGPSHTSGSILVAIPDAKVLFAGDALFTNFHPNLRDADMNGWIKVMDRIAAMDVQKIIPGHGPMSGKQDVADMKQYLLIFDSKARELAAKSNDAESIAAELKKALPKRDYFDMFIVSNVKAKYLVKNDPK